MGLLRPLITRTLAAATTALACLLPLPAAHAHSSSNAYLSLQPRGDALVLRADVHLRDADLALDLDTDRDGQVRWAEVSPRSAELLAWLRSGLALQAGDRACELQPIDLLASERSDGHYLSAEWTVACATPRPTGLALTYSLLFERDALHRALVKIEVPGAEGSAVLAPDRPQTVLLPEQPKTALQVFGHYAVEGVWHIWIGFDHILFLLSLLVLAPLTAQRRTAASRAVDWRPQPALRPALFDVLAVVTSFTVAHSITLGLAIFGVVSLPAVLIETVIAASVVLAALNNLLGGFSLKRWRLAFVFGLIHGFGFANVLLDLELPATQLAVALGGFNLGVELGQLAIVAVFFPIAWALRHTRFYQRGVVVGGSIGIALVGSWWIAERLGLIG
ncbi:HupE/UreJ family protein [Hydrogenophaga sp. T2]|uniref:HupE/UreJ family protein n=1 Tax=Hydrogenophaga sp. T2 TaxID=3132823 RepID=UPI003CE87B86